MPLKQCCIALLLAGTAWGGNCQDALRQTDETLRAGLLIAPQNLKQISKLRAEAEQACKEGRPADSIASLEKLRKLIVPPKAE
ncbi:hypothetical protein [Chitinimonas koreensis]|uniref:hypothetical protein n=1 Tax=Chitinimonas koreensis TaxID=356302 RepID=UPI00042843D3|nr:hypothetical protein [Chitinimonas koreensis]QNM97482.1 hypothetical protein H9L41_04020 [Chitinimonas koreensis]